MARVGTQSAVVNFSGGLVTEASPLTFPENSLSVAKNIEIGMDGTVRSRRPFQKIETSFNSGLSLTASYIKIKKYSWREKDRQVIVFVEPNAYGFKILDADGTSFSGRYSPPTGVTLNNPELLNVSFVDDHFFFVVNVRDTLSNYTQNFSTLVKGYYGISTLLFSGHYTASEASYIVSREPTVGSNLDVTLGGPFEEVISKMPFGWFRNEVYNHNGTYLCDMRLRWDAGDGEVLLGRDKVNDTWNSTLPVGATPADRIPFPSSLTVGGYTYFSDPGSEVVTKEGGFPQHDYSERETVRAVWRVKEGTYIKISQGSQPLRYRDFSGVPNIGHMGMDSVVKSDERHPKLTAFNAYNLYNAGWKRGTGSSMLVSNAEGTAVSHVGESYVKRTEELVKIYPSLSDSQFDFITDDTSNKSAIGLYSPFLLSRNKPYTSMARRGSNILTLYREYDPTGFTRERGSYFIPEFYATDTLPFTSEFHTYSQKKASSGRITASEHINGRMWYGVTGRDFNVMFSQIDYEGKDFTNETIGNLVNCFQQGDPNDEYNSSLLATDGGTLVLKDVGTIHSFKAFRQHILVFASEGVWAISGGGRDSFSPTSFSVSKLSSEGVSHNDAVLSTDTEVYYVSHNSLNSISINQYDILEVTDLSSAKVLGGFSKFAKLYNSSQTMLRGIVYDSENKRVVLNLSTSISEVFPTPLPALSGPKLGTLSYVYDIRMGAFYEWDTASIYVESNATQQASSNARGGFELPSFDPESEMLNVDLGLVEFNKGLGAVHLNVRGVVDAQGVIKFAMESGASRRLYLLTQRDEASALVDSPWQTTTGIGNRHFPVEIVVPYDTSNVPFVDKSIRTLSFFQELSNETVLSWTGSPTSRVIPTLDLSWEWDWDKGKGGSHTLASNIKYPEHSKVVDLEVGVSKTRLTGFGKALTLRVRPSKTTPISFKILGYFTEASMAGRS